MVAPEVLNNVQLDPSSTRKRTRCPAAAPSPSGIEMFAHPVRELAEGGGMWVDRAPEGSDTVLIVIAGIDEQHIGVEGHGAGDGRTLSLSS